MTVLKKSKVFFFLVASVMGLSFFTFIYRWNLVEKISFAPFRDSRISNVHLRDMTVEFELLDKKQWVNPGDISTRSQTPNNELDVNTNLHQIRDSIPHAKTNVTHDHITLNDSSTRTKELISNTYSVPKTNLASLKSDSINKTVSATFSKHNMETEKEVSGDRMTNTIAINAEILTKHKSKPAHPRIGFNKHRFGHRKKLKTNYMNSFTRIRDDLIQNGVPEKVAVAILKKHGIDSLSDLTSFQEVERRVDSCENCFKLNLTQMLVPTDMCAENADVLLLVTSTATNLEARSAIRETWGAACNTPTTNIRCVFVFGNTGDMGVNRLLQEEARTHNDILQIDFYDTYANLTYKTMTALRWAAQNCGNTKYVMKTDDDMFVNTELLPIFIQGAPKRDFLGGHCWGPSSPHRDPGSKWFVSFRQYNHPYFPAMCSGTGYIMSTDLISKIVNVSNNIPFFHLEDVYIAICAKTIGVQPLLLSGFKNEVVDFTPCVYRNLVITSHGFSPDSLRQVWRESRRCELSKLSPSQVFKSIRV
ncbi:uncharacterized protein LOC128226783 [Mya arenaria]|uniref:uncharacterized protein LOC128226783 n=1 Tax=Mya arenaria TaxID=6604 RepID=UPI0022E2C48F|nr:uncharacterized protein LOC128226783 [Mya arenaria]XP_052792800.1 uncharacterized protein LOC128226783 [Mya arenaria]XP_052792801.1 uncharacterized protein LOC128226783 [Mya arenaria]